MITIKWHSISHQESDVARTGVAEEFKVELNIDGDPNTYCRQELITARQLVSAPDPDQYRNFRAKNALSNCVMDAYDKIKARQS